MCFPTVTTAPLFGKKGPYHIRRIAKITSFYDEETDDTEKLWQCRDRAWNDPSASLKFNNLPIIIFIKIVTVFLVIYRNRIDFHILCSCPTTLLNSHINSNSFFVDPWNFLNRQLWCLKIKADLLFSSNPDNFNFVSCFISLARTQVQWIKWWWWEIALHFFLTGQVAL